MLPSPAHGTFRLLFLLLTHVCIPLTHQQTTPYPTFLSDHSSTSSSNNNSSSSSNTTTIFTNAYQASHFPLDEIPTQDPYPTQDPKASSEAFEEPQQAQGFPATEQHLRSTPDASDRFDTDLDASLAQPSRLLEPPPLSPKRMRRHAPKASPAPRRNLPSPPYQEYLGPPPPPPPPTATDMPPSSPPDTPPPLPAAQPSPETLSPDPPQVWPPDAPDAPTTSSPPTMPTNLNLNPSTAINSPTHFPLNDTTDQPAMHNTDPGSGNSPQSANVSPPPTAPFTHMLLPPAEEATAQSSLRHSKRRPPPLAVFSTDNPTPPPDQPPQPPLPPQTPDSPPWPPQAPSGFAPPTLEQSIGSFAQVGKSGVVAVHMIHLPLTDSYLLMERPSGYHIGNWIAGIFNAHDYSWKYISSPDSLFCAGHTHLDNGDVLIVGGHTINAGYPAGLQALRTFASNMSESALVKVGNMLYKRWYASATRLPSGLVLIMGGTQGVGAGTTFNKYYEIWDPAKPDVTEKVLLLPQYLGNAKQVYYPFNYVLPTGDLFTFCGRTGYIMDPVTGVFKTQFQVPVLRGYANTQYPFTAASVMLPMTPENSFAFEVLLVGGTNEMATKNVSIISTNAVQRLQVVIDPTDKSYTFVGWTKEYMKYPRVMPDSVLLPNGVVLLLSGAKTGLAGDSASGGDTRANFPQLVAELYDSYAPAGSRFTTVAASLIPRMYHSVAALTVNGTVLVAGCDRCAKYTCTFAYVPSTSKAEYRVEIYYPPFYYFFDQKPAFADFSADVMPYQASYVINYIGETMYVATVTTVVLVAPSSITHSFNTNQRVVGLQIVDNDPGAQIVTVLGPVDLNMAPPGIYMLFLLNGQVYSRAKWVTLSRDSYLPPS